MIKSMTGYGRGQSAVGEGSWVAELKTVNSRYLDFHLRLPAGLTALEERIKKFVGARLTRGRVSLSIAASGAVGAAPRLVLNRPLVREYRRVLAELQQELGITQDPGIAPFLHNRDLILSQEEGPDPEALWSQLEPALAQALDELEAMRAAEGRALADDLAARLEVVGRLFSEAAARSPQVVAGYQERLRERIAFLTGETEPDPQRLAMEVAVIADKADITEEAVRAASHLEQLRQFLQSSEPVGRKLDFLMQELNREANTMGSKTPDAEAGQTIVELKAELERIREQVQNIE
ncbi:MAG: YicC family protein [Proteobacteria bacterium]|nr:YicC family protein [Pseudomonadota bacterium]MBU1449928.1 YicC family protein [Pseudomonadota bacterium]MBU2468048.1 YicC family protein [Pseudomonadota bacterium]MBU2518811.1 YicC family protein [Pseudomonadota bacterium]